MADVNSTFKVYITNEPVFKVYVNNGAKGDTGEGVPAGGVANQYLVKLSGDNFDTAWQTIDSTQVAYGDGTVSEGLDSRYTKGETDLLLDDKSDVGHTHDGRYYTETETDALLSGKSDTTHNHDLTYSPVVHTHDDRYFTETEVGVLLSGKSDTTHNHDLTYAPIVHNHDDIYYTDDEVDTLLLSKSDTTHTHDLIKNATEANAKIEASSTGAVITRNVNDANIALKVNQQQGTGKILDAQFGGASKFSVDKNGEVTASLSFATAYGLKNVNGATFSYVNVDTTGTKIERNIADANPALKVNQANASSTGNIQEWQFGGAGKSFMTTNGQLGLNQGIRNYTTGNNSAIDTATTGVSITRNIADANSVLIVNNRNASSTGNIAEFQFNGTTKLAIDKNGLVPATNIANTPAGNISATTVQTAINELDTEKADKLYATNLVTNGDFSNGTTGWVITNGTLSVSAGKLLATVDNTTQTRVGNPLSIVNGRKYYIRAESLDKTNLVNLTLTTRSADAMSLVQVVDDLYSRTPLSNYSIVFTATANAGSVAFNFGPSSAPATITLGKFLVIDLTSIFGAGKEPSKEQMDNMLSTFTNSWFNGTAELVSIANLAQLKADKVQEEWITPTLMNGWTVRSGNTIKYRKNNFGSVIVQGEIVPGSATAFILPVGYRPSHNMVFVCPTSGGGIVTFSVNSDGGFTHNTGTLGTYVDLSSIEFYVA